MPSFSATAERWLAVACVALGGCVAAVLAPKDSYFVPNFLFYWGSQLLLVAFALAFRPRGAVIAGIAFSLALYLGLFGAWEFTRVHPESLAWLGYVYSLPGAVVAVILVGLVSRRRPDLSASAGGLLAVASVATGVALNQAVVCSTVMYCGGK